ncbi:MAG: PaaI family thioesterase [Pseudomonadota bacterium]
MPLQMNVDDLSKFLSKEFLQVADDFAIDNVEEGWIQLRLVAHDKHLRPGGTVSGPAMFALADVSAYLVTLAMIGPKALAVTTNCSIDFMRKPRAGADLIARCTLLKLGKHLSVSDVLLYSEGQDAPVARATLTYAIPQK